MFHLVGLTKYACGVHAAPMQCTHSATTFPCREAVGEWQPTAAVGSLLAVGAVFVDWLVLPSPWKDCSARGPTAPNPCPRTPRLSLPETCCAMRPPNLQPRDGKGCDGKGKGRRPANGKGGHPHNGKGGHPRDGKGRGDKPNGVMRSRSADAGDMDPAKRPRLGLDRTAVRPFAARSGIVDIRDVRDGPNRYVDAPVGPPPARPRRRSPGVRVQRSPSPLYQHGMAPPVDPDVHVTMAEREPVLDDFARREVCWGWLRGPGEARNEGRGGEDGGRRRDGARMGQGWEGGRAGGWADGCARSGEGEGAGRMGVMMAGWICGCMHAWVYGWMDGWKQREGQTNG